MIGVNLVDVMGNDLTVVNAARVSFDKHVEVFEETRDDRLIAYLARHDHWTPFAHPQAQFRISAPIYVANQLKRHQVGFALNEVSRRYVDDDPEFYQMTGTWRGRPTDGAKQGSSGLVDDSLQHAASKWQNDVERVAMNVYQSMLEHGIAPEQARGILPQTMITKWYWTGSLAAWARLCIQRLDKHTQTETRIIAGMISEEMEILFPVSWKVLVTDKLKKGTE